MGMSSNKAGVPDQRELLYQLITSEERYRNFMNASTDAIYISNLTGLILDINNTACESLGYSRTEIINSYVWDIEIAITKEGIKQHSRNIANGPINLQGCHRRKDGTTFPVDVRLSTFNSMGEQLVLAIVRDISEQKRSESTIRKLTRALDQSPVLVIITDREGTIEYVNRKVIEQTAFSYDEIIGQNSRILQSGETPKETYKLMWEQLSNGGEWHGEMINKTKNGEQYWVSAIISPLRGEEDEKISHYLAIMEDISNKKNAK